MEVAAVLRFFGLTSQSSIADLNSSYKRYLRRYHPDFNAGEREWAERMTEKLNLAYGVALAHITDQEQSRAIPVIAASEKGEKNERSRQTGSAEPKGRAKSNAKANPHGRASADRFFGNSGSAGISTSQQRYDFFNTFYQAVDEILEGIYIYYQYGLENIHLRHEGVRSYRFRSSLRKITDATAALEQLREYKMQEQDYKNLTGFIEFANAFLQNMRIEKIHSPSGPRSDTLAYQHYSRAALMLDRAIRDTFFEELRDTNRSAASPENLDLCTREFMVVLTEHLHSRWITEAAIKVYLLEVFTRLIQSSRNSF